MDADEQRDHRANHGDQQRQAKVEIDHHAEHAEHEQAVANDNGHGVGDGFGDLLRVEGELRDQRARRTAVVVLDGQAQVTVEQFLAQVAYCRSADPGQTVNGQKVHRAA